MPTVSHERLRDFGAAIFRAAGVPDDQADVAIGHLVESNLMGHDSHGVLHLAGYTRSLVSGAIRPVGDHKIMRETPVSCVIDADRAFGIVLTYQAMQMAIEKAQANTLGAVAVHRASHIGRLGAYPPMAAEQDCIGVLMLNGGGRFAAPFGGVDRRLPPNPIAMSVPTLDGPPLMLDMTTSMVAGGKVLVQQSKGLPLPLDWMVDQEGNPVTDPGSFRAGTAAMLPLGGSVGHKGYGLAMMIDAIAGGLSWAGCSADQPTRGGSGYLALAIKIESFIDLDEYKREVQRLVDWVKSSKTMPGVEQIYVPGEPEQKMMRERTANGIPIPEPIWEDVLAAANEVGVEW
ncbi:MAG: Ldh family oxidoreductase [Caldilineaceae bacterium]|nr:Ldh family oxidoreductase [Caldilineaceae bacterium]